MEKRKYNLGDLVLLERVNYDMKVEYYDFGFCGSGSPSPMPNEWIITTVNELYTYINEYLTMDGEIKKITSYSVSFELDNRKRSEDDAWVKKFESNLHKDLMLDMIELLKDKK
jgi:hypothetical protein